MSFEHDDIVHSLGHQGIDCMWVRLWQAQYMYSVFSKELVEYWISYFHSEDLAICLWDIRVPYCSLVFIHALKIGGLAM